MPSMSITARTPFSASRWPCCTPATTALFSLFGEGGGQGYRDIYAPLRSSLPVWAQEFWDEKIAYYFNPKGLRRSFYLRGAAGDFAWTFNSIMLPGQKKSLALALLEAGSLAEQQRCYNRLEAAPVQ